LPPAATQRLIPEQQAFFEIREMAALVMGFRWRPDECAQVLYGPAGV